ncbi:MAG: M48 family metalloprotease [Saprospiraceae bacterium]|nr:M48 family metalloprotease [Saprospiraceae bacterium]
MRVTIIGNLLLVLAFVLLADSCAVNPVSGKKQLMLLSEDQEKALGLESDPGILASYGVYDDAKLQQFITEKGKKMGAISHRPNLDYKFKVLDSPVVNAFAVPGGYVYFTRGILAYFNNEAQFAGVLGHEIGHVTARHSAQQYSQQILAQAGLMIGMVVSEDFRKYAEVANVGVSLLFLKFSRDHESESDKLGVAYSSQIGYDAHEMAKFFNTLSRLSGDGGQSLPTFLSTHPNPDDRNKKVDEMATNWAQKSPGAKLDVNRDSYLRMIDGLVYGEDPRQGYVENDNFYHPELKFQYAVPSGWQLVNSPSQVQMAPKDGKALMIFTLSQEKTLQAAAQGLLTQYQLTKVSSRETTINGLPALEMVAEQAAQTQDQQQQQQQQQSPPVRLLTYQIQYNGLIYQFLGVTEKANYSSYEPTFMNVIKSFKELKEAGKLNRQPERIRIKTVDRSGTFADALKAFNMPEKRHKELAILNGMELNSPVTKGMLIKVVGN